MLVIEYSQNLTFGVEFDIKQKEVKRFKENLQRSLEGYFPNRNVNTTQYRDYVKVTIEVKVTDCSDVVRQFKGIVERENLEIV